MINYLFIHVIFISVGIQRICECTLFCYLSLSAMNLLLIFLFLFKFAQSFIAKMSHGMSVPSYLCTFWFFCFNLFLLSDAETEKIFVIFMNVHCKFFFAMVSFHFKLLSYIFFMSARVPSLLSLYLVIRMKY